MENSFQRRITEMAYSYIAGPSGKRWESFNFVSNMKSPLDIAMLISKLEMDSFEMGGSEWAGSWGAVANSIRTRCDSNQSQVGFLRLSCHGNVGIFRMGNSIFAESNASQWTPIVSQIAGYFVPGVSFVTIDSCKTGAGQGILEAFSQALGGVDVRGYEELQTKSTSEDSDRGAFSTCRVKICTRTPGI
jgi:hypothetical protein